MTRWLLALLLTTLAAGASADVFQPAYLELRETAPERYAVLWNVPALGSQQRLPAQVRFPQKVEQLSMPRSALVNGTWTERWEIHAPGGLSGETISIEGNGLAATQVIARIEHLDGRSQVENLSMDSPHFTIIASAGMGAVARSYLLLGFEHILGGTDHLLFLLALLLIVRGARRIILTITAFTVAHSITLAAATLGWVQVPGAPVEAVIALSIVFVASEVIHAENGRTGLTERAPWVVAFSFGLLHGFGFAGALAEVGLPQAAIPLALFTFNVGVELGQLAFVAAVLALQALILRRSLDSVSWLRTTAAYAIGSIAAFWTIERILAFSTGYTG